MTKEKNPNKRYDKIMTRSVQVSHVTHHKLKVQSFKEDKSIKDLIDNMLNDRIKTFKRLRMENRKK